MFKAIDCPATMNGAPGLISAKQKTVFGEPKTIMGEFTCNANDLRSMGNDVVSILEVVGVLVFDTDEGQQDVRVRITDVGINDGRATLSFDNIPVSKDYSYNDWMRDGHQKETYTVQSGGRDE